MRSPAGLLDKLRAWNLRRQAKRPYLRRLEDLKGKRSVIVGNLQELAGRIRSLKEQYRRATSEKTAIENKISDVQEKLDGIQ